MTLLEVSSLKRSYDRDLGWCRFWLGISLAVATLTFTFAVNQVFDPLFVRGPIGTDEQVKMEDSNRNDQVVLSEVLVISGLILTNCVCIVLSLGFRVLYRRSDAALTAIGLAHHNESS
jgi:hypothetical protein